MYDVGISGDRPRLVGLEPSDEVPSWLAVTERRELGDLGRGLLSTTLAQVGHAEIAQNHGIACREELRDRNQG